MRVLLTILAACSLCLVAVNAVPSKADIAACFKASISPMTSLFFNDTTAIINGTNAYYTARRANNARSLDFYPAVIVNVKKVGDIQAAVMCGSKLGLPVTAMAGGHAYEIGYGTTGIMLWLSDYNNVASINLNPTNPSVKVQSGIRNARLYGLLLQASAKLAEGSKYILSSGMFFDVGVVGK